MINELNLNGTNIIKFLKDNPQFCVKQGYDKLILSDQKNEFKVDFDQKNDYKPISLLEIKQNKVNEAVKLHELWLYNQKYGKRITILNYPSSFFESCNLENKNLTGADFMNRYLFNVNFKNTLLVSADLRGCRLQGANLYRANLCSAKLDGANLEGANLTNCLVNIETTGIHYSLYEKFFIRSI